MQQKVRALFEQRALFVPHHLTAAERKTLQRITQGLPPLRSLQAIMDEVYRLVEVVILELVLGERVLSASAAPILSIEPSSLVVQPGQNFSLNVRITNVTDLYAFQFDVVFNHTMLSATNIPVEGPFLPTGGATFFIPGTINNTSGTITATADTLIGAIQGVTGTGTLATISFHALAPGTTPITLANAILLDSTLTIIPVSIANGMVQVGATPIPALSPFAQALLVVVVCSSGLLFLLRRRRTV